MDYPIVTIHVVEPIFQNVPMFSQKGCIATRINFFCKTVFYAIGFTSDAVLGVVGACGVVLTLGLHQETMKFSVRHLGATNYIVAIPLCCLVSTVNPDIVDGITEEDAKQDLSYFTAPVATYFKESITACIGSDSLVHRQVTSRFLYLVALVASVVAGVADGVMGLIAMGAVCCTLGMVPALNKAAFHELTGFGCIGSIVITVLGIVNPQAVLECVTSSN